MKKEEILMYEMSNSIAENISWGWGQTIMAKLIARKVNRKWKRYQQMLERAKRVRLFKKLYPPQEQ